MKILYAIQGTGNGHLSRAKDVFPALQNRADVDFAREEAYLPYGVIGIKVWIYRGEIFEKEKGVQK